MDLLKRLGADEKKEIVILNSPESFAETISEFKERVTVYEDVNSSKPYELLLVFAVNSIELREYAAVALPNANEETIIWFGYPKRYSKKYNTDITRTLVWKHFGGYSLEPIKQIPIDRDWSALQLKRIDISPLPFSLDIRATPEED